MIDAYIFDALRTPRGKGKSTGSLHQVRAIELLTTVLKEMQCRHNLDTAQVDDGIFGCVTPVEDQGGNIAKAALLFADWDNSVGGMQINRFCCSGLRRTFRNPAVSSGTRAGSLSIGARFPETRIVG